ncbi:ribosome biogenesis factor YjgA [Comamonas badia]|jgi:ribosome-associated protein|uniref:ribosome biogenesis factor YjgA n=1 Tax=Comamonas badia TaxID=265291 RepID=UPI0004168CAE|nr:ribosome biogenesis factor YjgA [Comamonas badia]
MPRKPTRGYYVKGQFIAEGSELDEQFKSELRGTPGQSKTDLKRESTELQALGAALLTLSADRLDGLQLPERLLEALAEARRITAHEGRRRQMQLVGKLMRKLDQDTLTKVRESLASDGAGHQQEVLALHQAEQWRERLLADDEVLSAWLDEYPGSDIQHLRTLIRQARKDNPPLTAAEVSQGAAPRRSRAYRELFQVLRAQVLGTPQDTNDDHE